MSLRAAAFRGVAIPLHDVRLLHPAEERRVRNDISYFVKTLDRLQPVRFFDSCYFFGLSPIYFLMMTKPITPHDEAILTRQAQRDYSAFATLYRRYLSPIYRYLYQRLGNQQEAEDLTAQVFTEALEGLIARRYREGGKFAAWLYTIARHKLIDFYRKRPHLSLDEHFSTPSDLLTDIEAGDDQSRIAHLLAQLDDEKRELLRLRFTLGMSFAEIAAMDGRSEAAIKMAIYRALDWLRNHWEDDHG